MHRSLEVDRQNMYSVSTTVEKVKNTLKYGYTYKHHEKQSYRLRKLERSLEARR